MVPESSVAFGELGISKLLPRTASRPGPRILLALIIFRTEETVQVTTLRMVILLVVLVIITIVLRLIMTSLG